MEKSKKFSGICIKHYLTKIDQFGAPIKLTHKGDETFKTVYGGVSTTLIGIYLMYFSINTFLPVITSEISGF
jgi:hypothetical protein